MTRDEQARAWNSGASAYSHPRGVGHYFGALLRGEIEPSEWDRLALAGYHARAASRLARNPYEGSTYAEAVARLERQSRRDRGWEWGSDRYLVRDRDGRYRVVTTVDPSNESVVRYVRPSEGGEYAPGWQRDLAARIVERERSERIAGVSVWEVTAEHVATMRPHQLGHLRRAAKLLARDSWRDSQMRAAEVLRLTEGTRAAI